MLQVDEEWNQRPSKQAAVAAATVADAGGAEE